MTTEPKGLTDAERDAIVRAVYREQGRPAWLTMEIPPHDRRMVTAAYAAGAASVPREPIAWMFPRRYGSGLSFMRPADYEDAEGNIVRPVPLYAMYDAATGGKG